MLAECNKNIWSLELHGCEEIYIDLYKDTFYHDHNQMVSQMIILIQKKKLFGANFLINLPRWTTFKEIRRKFVSMRGDD